MTKYTAILCFLTFDEADRAVRVLRDAGYAVHVTDHVDRESAETTVMEVWRETTECDEDKLWNEITDLADTQCGGLVCEAGFDPPILQ